LKINSFRGYSRIKELEKCMAYKNKAAADSINIKLDQISEKLAQVSQ
jgi:hypothetical protein